MNVSILFEDDGILAVNKPSGMTVNNAQSTTGLTLAEWASGYLKLAKTDADFFDRSGIVHRLDRETSGVVLIAKTADYFHLLQKQFQDRSVSKKYQTLVHGRIPTQEGQINAPVGRLPWNRMHFGVLPGGRDALTTFSRIDTYSGILGQVSYLEVIPKTGRTHQIRIHLKYLGHPVVADPLYCGSSIYKSDILVCPRLFLHARSLSFTHPKTLIPIVVEAPMPQELLLVLSRLQSEEGIG
jgi:23S rRNA pseudouridine1911/1915/1917 synthase